MKTQSIKFRIALLGITAILSLACHKERDCQETASLQRNFTETFYATIEGQESTGESPSTKVYADENMRVLWNKEDRITIFDHYTYNLMYQFMGEDGDNAGTFQLVPPSEFVTGNDTQYIYAVYPYSSTTAISNDEVISVDLPLAQLYKENSFGLSANTMVSVTKDEKLKFRNVGSYLSFRLYGDNVTISGIEFKGNNGEKIAGRARIVMTPGGIPETTMTADAKESIEVFCAPVVTIGPDEESATEFWFVIPPATLTKGFTITVTGSNGETFVKSVSSNIVLERNKLKRMKPLKVEISPDNSIPVAVDLGLPSGLKWASFNIGATLPEEMGYYYAWGEIKPKSEYSWDNYKWGNGREKSLTKYNRNSQFGVVDDRMTIVKEDDVAYMEWGGKWRIPAKEDYLELVSNCDRKREIRNGIAGVTFTSIHNGNTLFLPLAGEMCYWMASLNPYLDSPTRARCASFNKVGGVFVNDSYAARYVGLPIRAVYEERPSFPIPTAVDLGLSVKWASFNVGASAPEEVGNYYAWGETKPKHTYYWHYYKWCEGGPQYTIKYNYYDRGDRIVDRKYVLDLEDDVASVEYGDNWRMPTAEEFDELLTKCTWKWTTQRGLKGYLVSAANGESIFIPSTGVRYENKLPQSTDSGCYWSSSLSNSGDGEFAKSIKFDSRGYSVDSDFRYYGLTVRAVYVEK